jgi:ParB-like chromosome segregation protein Spo0J
MKLRVSEIIVGKRFRAIDRTAVEEIAAAFKEDGQRRPIIVRTDGKRPRLVAGARRLAAAKLLRWTHIEAASLKLDGMSPAMADLEARIAEIDDNSPSSKLRRRMDATARALCAWA